MNCDTDSDYKAFKTPQLVPNTDVFGKLYICGTTDYTDTHTDTTTDHT